jgi:hypothetical protein
MNRWTAGGSIEIAASAAEVYELVSDVTGCGAWTAETTGARWLDGTTGPVVGGRFVGWNQNGWHRWWTRRRVLGRPRRRLTPVPRWDRLGAFGACLGLTWGADLGPAQVAALADPPDHPARASAPSPAPSTPRSGRATARGCAGADVGGFLAQRDCGAGRPRRADRIRTRGRRYMNLAARGMLPT